ncbi:MAG: DUF2071 domain-containing protein [Gemmatimonadetes bacterium]|nr:DUF2071 domain-containing protein [Gemmatimonadota bacterium]NIR80877.1 DUF2071 domain-containing protein [Gemmatimonadota bacterium]NIT89696.1 DUF2071 domain-containing protein [Gemmatimonadota bacterium]NIU33480.1 DUF2071 domain-containing protein [Gemmatimonadota bacterium]NIU37762.1 DUF2071 domain-containing protein [Gemmatimonadota bacterium]
MTWHDLLFAHWPMDADALRPHLPSLLEVDTFGGSAWIGVVPFRMSGIRLRRLPPIPTARALPELNVRTYVRGGGLPGVWFFSLDAASRLVVWTARAWYGLPYHHAEMECTETDEGIRYRSRRHGVGNGRVHAAGPGGVRARGGGDAPRRREARFRAVYGPAGPASPAETGGLEHFLVERYRLFSRGRSGELRRAEIRHEPWPLRPAEAEIEVNTVAEASGISLPGGEPLLHFARRVEVRAWSPEPL